MVAMLKKMWENSQLCGALAAILSIAERGGANASRLIYLTNARCSYMDSERFVIDCTSILLLL